RDSKMINLHKSHSGGQLEVSSKSSLFGPSLNPEPGYYPVHNAVGIASTSGHRVGCLAQLVGGYAVRKCNLQQPLPQQPDDPVLGDARQSPVALGGASLGEITIACNRLREFVQAAVFGCYGFYYRLDPSVGSRRD